MATPLTVKIKPTSGAVPFEVSIAPGATIAELKEAVAAQLGEEGGGAGVRLIYRGQILKDAQSLDSYGVGHEHVVHMVKARPAG